jgi:hypothetical protein
MALTLANLIRGQGKLMAASVDFYNTSKNWQAQSQIMAASAAYHAHATGDIRAINVVVASMPKGTKANSLRDYFAAFAPVKWSEATKRFKFDSSKQVTLVTGDGVEHELLSAMLAKSWWEMRKEETADNYKPFDLGAKLLRLVKESNKALEEGDKTKEKITKAEVAALEDLVRRLYPNGLSKSA